MSGEGSVQEVGGGRDGLESGVDPGADGRDGPSEDEWRFFFEVRGSRSSEVTEERPVPGLLPSAPGTF